MKNILLNLTPDQARLVRKAVRLERARIENIMLSAYTGEDIGDFPTQHDDANAILNMFEG